ncbi:MAG TPA: phosphoadenylyl-sulfate reductase [Candidatus Acidoferrales bacterium]|nr:phosphoadenylyl-sulfate reductase [Candidatus Acidoferrales bacterium]
MVNLNQEEISLLNKQFEPAHPAKVLEWVSTNFRIGDIAMATGFGAEGVVIVDMIASVNKGIPIFYLDTDVLFPETYVLRDRLEEKYGIRLIRYATPISLEQQAKLHGANLWESNPDLCCNIRKVEPLREALKNYFGWITAVRREQSPGRSNAGLVEWDKRFNLLKINPLAGWTKKEVWKYIVDHEVPYNPLYDSGYASIGCTHCTTPVAAGEDDRAGRWRGFQKKECGLHVIDPQNREERPNA